MGDFIQPRVLKGFRDVLPVDELIRRQTETVLERIFRLYGFVPIDTPVLEYADILLGKGGGETDKQVYRFHDHGDRDVAMRFDLTVPFARFMAMHANDLPTPFKRYHIAKVYRGENTQRGRYREFYQCDFDIVGCDDAASDTEILVLIRRAIETLGVSEFRIHVAHRGLFNRYLSGIGVDNPVEVLRIVDKLRKVGTESVREMLVEIVSPESADRILEYIAPDSDFNGTLGKLETLVGECDETKRMRSIHSLLTDSGFADLIVLDPSITRGLDYYTGIVYETFLTHAQEYGSICSGGRYDDLASLYTKATIPGVGASIGLDRLLAALEELESLPAPDRIPEVAIFNLDGDLMPHYFRLAERVRESGLSCEVYFEQRKLGAQFNRAEKTGTRFAVICGETEHADGLVNLKELDSRENHNGVTIEAAIGLMTR